jgi:hypothetical protein
MMCEEMKQGGNYLSSTAASVWPDSGMIDTEEKRLHVYLLPTRPNLEEREETAGRHGLGSCGSFAWFGCEHISCIMPAYLPLHPTARANPLIP